MKTGYSMKLKFSSDIDLVAFVEDVEKEWTPERITRWLLERERSRYAFYKRRRKEVEIENKEARMRGVSYKDRQKYSRQLVALEGLLIESEAKGKDLSHCVKTEFYKGPASLYITDHFDAEFIHSRGFESYLRCATM